ncbi:MAG: hypothetical protein CMK54_05970 [Proteobacteria bacterium]|nr:hypothetical protein [Pseudomonadota bacterium]
MNEDGHPVDFLITTSCPVAMITVVPRKPLWLLEKQDETGKVLKILEFLQKQCFQPMSHE